MRPKFIFALLLAVLALLCAVIFFKQHSARAPKSAAPDSDVATAISAVAPRPRALPPLAPAAVPLTPEQRQASIDAEVDRLQDWSTQDDPAFLSNILADLSNPEKEVREAAIEAAKQFGSADAIPALKNAAATTADPDEQIEFLQAAEFLSETPISDPGVQLPRTAAQIQADALRHQSLMPKHLN